jgi:hypothetical protein
MANDSNQRDAYVNRIKELEEADSTTEPVEDMNDWELL